jgi:hypothetical protein
MSLFRTFIGGRAANASFEDDMKILDPLKGEPVVLDLAEWSANPKIAGAAIARQHRHTIARLAEEDEPVPPFTDYVIEFEPDFSRNGEEDDSA